MKYTLALILFIAMGKLCSAQSAIKVFGTISDAASGEALPNASIYNTNTLKGAVANAHGYYSLVISTNGKIQLQVSYIGYKSKLIPLQVNCDTTINIQLESGVQLQEFEVSAKRYQQMVKQTGLTKMPVKDIIFAPVFMGEANLISALKTLPGVSSGKEGGSELFVRGGSYDQNLILLDNAPVYNLNHAFGLLSVFSAATLKNVNLYKGGIPSEYGGRLSSVLDVNTREGNNKEYKGELSLSTIAGAFTFEGPILKDKASFLFSARRSWVDKLVLAPMNTADEKMGLDFYDINAKVNFKVKEKHNFYLSYYSGKDELSAKFMGSDENFAMHQGWGNQLGSLRYTSILNNGAFAEATTYYTEFKEYNNTDFNDADGFVTKTAQSTLKELGFKSAITWPLTQKLSLKTGLEANWRGIEPPNRKSEIDGTVTQINSQDYEEQMSYNIFASSTYKHNKWRAEFGLRASLYAGKQNSYAYLEPRLNASYQWAQNLKLKAGAMRNVQPLYAMQKNNNGFPGYTWIPLSNQLIPQESYQTSLGATFTKGSWMIDVEAYYKAMKNQASNYRFPYDLYSNNEWHTLIDQGEGRAYGIEFLGTYNNAGWDIRLSYTLAKAESEYNEVNEGEWFPFDYDVRHDASLVASKTVFNKGGRKHWFTSNFSIHSGTPVTMPTSTIPTTLPIFDKEEYFFDFSKADVHSRPNNARFPTYHRLDLGYHMQKEKDRGSRTWSLGVINAYNKQNPYIYYRSDKGQFQQLTMFPLMPFVSFKRNF